MNYIYGASGHGGVIASILLDKGINKIAFYDDDPLKTRYKNIEVISQKEFGRNDKIIIAIGDNKTRYKLSRRFEEDTFLTVIHPSSYINETVKIHHGTVIMQHVTIQIGSTIGKHSIINTGAIVDHDCVIDDYVHISPGAILAGGVQINEGAWIGAGATILPGIKIGKWSIVGAGAVVLEDVDDNCIVVGNPARLIKKTNE